MPHMNREHKARIRAELLKVIPKDWKWGLTIEDKSTIVLTIKSAPVDICRSFWKRMKQYKYRNGNHAPAEPPVWFSIHPCYPNYDFSSEFTGEVSVVFKKIAKALNLDNFDHSDPSVDEDDVGHYVEVHVGTEAVPFIFDEANILSGAIAKPKSENRTSLRV